MRKTDYDLYYFRGKSRVFHYQDILDAKNFKPFADTFFCILTYNPEARRLANTNGEIRVGPSHQAKFMPCSEITEPLSEAEQRCDMSETVLWDYKAITDTNLFAYLQAARSIAAFAGWFWILLFNSGTILISICFIFADRYV